MEHMDDVPSWVNKYLARSPAPESSPWLRDGVALYYYQLAALDYMERSNAQGTIAAFSMGTGKTITALERIARTIYGAPGAGCTYPQPHSERTCLLVTPPALFDTWTSTISKCFRPGTFRTLVIDQKARTNMRERGSVYRQSVMQSPQEKGANLVLVSSAWLVAVTRHARTRLGNCSIAPVTSLSNGYISCKNARGAFVQTGFAAGQMREFIAHRRAVQSEAIRAGIARVQCLADIDAALWRDIIACKVQPMGAADYTAEDTQRWTFLGEVDWAYVVVDEAHALNNEGTKLLATMNMLRARKRLYATGTPMETGDGQLRTLLRSLGCADDVVVEPRRWKACIAGPTMPIGLRQVIDRYVLYLPKMVIEEQYCARAQSAHVRAARLGLPVPPVLLKQAVVETERLAARSQAEVDACNHVLNVLIGHMPRWAVEVKERIERRKTTAKARRKRERDGTAATPAKKKSKGQEDAHVPSMADVLSDARPVVALDGEGSALRSAQLSPLDGARYMRDLCFSPTAADPRTLVAAQHIELLAVRGARLTFEGEEWTREGAGEEECDACRVTYRLAMPRARGTPPLRTSIVRDPLLPRALVEQARAAGNSAKIARIVKGVLDSPPHTKHVIFVRQYTQIYLLMEAFRAALGTSPLVLFGLIKSAAARRDVVEAFKRNLSARVMIANPDVAGVGLDFSFADVAWLPTPHFNPKRDEQCADRVNRLGRAADAPAAQIRYMTLEDTLEDAILTKRKSRTDTAAFLLGATNIHPDAVFRNGRAVLVEATEDEREKLRQVGIMDAIRATERLRFTHVAPDSLLHCAEESDDDDDGLCFIRDGGGEADPLSSTRPLGRARPAPVECMELDSDDSEIEPSVPARGRDTILFLNSILSEEALNDIAAM